MFFNCLLFLNLNKNFYLNLFKFFYFSVIFILKKNPLMLIENNLLKFNENILLIKKYKKKKQILFTKNILSNIYKNRAIINRFLYNTIKSKKFSKIIYNNYKLRLKEILLVSKLVLSENEFFFFLKNNFIFKNFFICKKNCKLSTGDFIFICISKYYYMFFLIKFINLNKLKKIYNFYFYNHIPRYIEVDFQLNCIIIIYTNLKIYDINNIFFYLLNWKFYKFLNWKFLF